MTWFIKDLNYTNEAFAYATDCFTTEELDLIEELAKNSSKQGAGELENGATDTNYRSNKISWIAVSEESKAIYAKLTGIVEELNNRFYRYDLTEMEELQYAEYHNETADCYKSHSDDGYAFNLFRKLSVSIQLSNEDEYEGGDLILYRHSFRDPATAPKIRGTVVVFPSYVIHEVTPVTKGMRKSLIAWIIGPRFK